MKRRRVINIRRDGYGMRKNCWRYAKYAEKLYLYEM